jgi:type I restriction enzyme S subunit
MLLALLDVPLPPLVEQQRIVGEVERLLSEVDAARVSVTRDLRRCARLRQSILKWAFEGKLADQDPSDEPASVLLERIRTETAARAASALTNARPKRQGPKGTIARTKHTK